MVKIVKEKLEKLKKERKELFNQMNKTGIFSGDVAQHNRYTVINTYCELLKELLKEYEQQNISSEV